ncbi:MAG: SMC-Scp complex subunit ScpB [SAR324 cluster bacterium]|nr:SMC-Scp complex subunit ScpB [SAR324 cluster bacterium]
MIKEKQLQRIIEGLLFAAEATLSTESIAKIISISEDEVRQIILKLNKFYKKTDRSFLIYQKKSGWQIRTVPELSGWLSKMAPFRKMNLSVKSLETLSVIAYRQPITKIQIDSVRTTDSNHTLQTLLKLELIKISGRSKLAGRAFNYRTTDFFLEMFDFSSLEDLPRANELKLF